MEPLEVVFESERIKFTKLDESLIDEYLKMVNDPEVACRISHNPRTYTYEEEKLWVNTKLKNNATCYSMIEKVTGKYIGCIEMVSVTGTIGEIGICITRNMQDKHFGTEAMKAMVEYGYNVLKLNAIYLNVFNDNLRARKCYKNAGFVDEGPGKELDDIKMIHWR